MLVVALTDCPCEIAGGPYDGMGNREPHGGSESRNTYRSGARQFWATTFVMNAAASRRHHDPPTVLRVGAVCSAGVVGGGWRLARTCCCCCSRAVRTAAVGDSRRHAVAVYGLGLSKKFSIFFLNFFFNHIKFLDIYMEH